MVSASLKEVGEGKRAQALLTPPKSSCSERLRAVAGRLSSVHCHPSASAYFMCIMTWGLPISSMYLLGSSRAEISFVFLVFDSLISHSGVQCSLTQCSLNMRLNKEQVTKTSTPLHCPHCETTLAHRLIHPPSAHKVHHVSSSFLGITNPQPCQAHETSRGNYSRAFHPSEIPHGKIAPRTPQTDNCSRLHR